MQFCAGRELAIVIAVFEKQVLYMSIKDFFCTYKYTYIVINCYMMKTDLKCCCMYIVCSVIILAVIDT